MLINASLSLGKRRLASHKRLLAGGDGLLALGGFFEVRGLQLRFDGGRHGLRDGELVPALWAYHGCFGHGRYSVCSGGTSERQLPHFQNDPVFPGTERGELALEPALDEDTVTLY
ncbi:MAG: hypothetical protein K2X32_04980 [Phycisphaerales bacterium]|nr:hypothetical protein [Phycisphaerales bacterium]